MKANWTRGFNNWSVVNWPLVFALGALIAAAGIWFAAAVPPLRAEQFRHRPGLVTVSATIDRDTCDNMSCSHHSYFASYSINGLAEQDIRIIRNTTRTVSSPVQVLVDPEHPQQAQLVGERDTVNLALAAVGTVLAVVVAALLVLHWTRLRRIGSNAPRMPR